jgi:hypothetical protein
MTKDEHTMMLLRGQRIARNFEARERERATRSTGGSMHPKLRAVLEARARRLFAPRGRPMLTIADGVLVSVRPDGSIWGPNGRIS